MEERNETFFGLETTNRVSFLREDETFIREAFQHSSTNFIPFLDGNAFTDVSGTDLLLLSQQANEFPEWRRILDKIEPVMDTEAGWMVESGFVISFLGLQDYKTASDAQFRYKEYSGRPIFAMDLHPTGKTLITVEETRFLKDNFEALQRMQTFNLSNEVASLFSHATMYLDWLRKFIYCAGCGSKMYPVHGGTKLQCGNKDMSVTCPVRDAKVSNVCFPRTDPVVIVAIVDRTYSKICLARSRRKYNNAVMYSTIAGFMEPAETIEHACQREIWEETGVKVGITDIDILFSQPWPYPSNLMIGCLGVVDFNGENENINLEHDQELLDAQWFDMKLVAEAFDLHDSKSTELVKFDNEITFPGRTAIAYQLIQHAVVKYKRINGNL